MDNQNNIPAAQAHRGAVNGQQGTWVPVDAESVPFPVSGDVSNPSKGKDGSYYYSQGGQPSTTGGFGPIAANQYNAIPMPSNIVQLPPIVQPIALVPFASQNQPLVTYDPSHREEIARTNLEPIYRAKPYSALSVICALLGVIAVAVMLIIGCAGHASALDTIFGLLAVAGMGGLTSQYHTDVLSKIFTDGFSSGFSADAGAAAVAIMIPIFYAIAIVCGIIAVIYFLVKLGKRESPRGFKVITLIGLIAAVVALILIFAGKDISLGAGAIITVLLFIALLIVPFLAKPGAQVIDYEESKRLYAGDNRQ